MRGRTTGLLLVLAAATLAGGWYFGRATAPADRTAMAGGQLMFPGLAQRLTDLAKVDITNRDKLVTIEKRPGGGWGVASMHDYPVRDSKLRGLLTGLTELRLSEPRTSDPSEYGRLGVDDPAGASATGDLVRLIDTRGQPILALIAGHRRVSGQVDAPGEIYVRRPDEDRSWLAEGSVDADSDASQWLDRTILNIAHGRIASVTVGDRALVFGRQDGTFVLTQPADHPKLEAYRVEDVAGALESLTFEQVEPDKNAAGTDAGRAVFATSDGLAITVSALRDGKDVWVRFSAAASSADAKVESAALNGRLAGWMYRIGAWKEKALMPGLADLTAAAPAAPAEPDGGKK